VTTFHDMRRGHTSEGVKVDRATSIMSTAEAVSVGVHSSLFAAFFGGGEVKPEHVAINLSGAVAKENRDDLKALRSYWEVAVKPRAKREVGLWKAYYKAGKHLK